MRLIGSCSFIGRFPCLLLWDAGVASDRLYLHMLSVKLQCLKRGYHRLNRFIDKLHLRECNKGEPSVSPIVGG